MAWKKVAENGSIEYGTGTEVQVDGKRIAVFCKDAMCAHQNQSIACGTIEDGIVECPHHFWHYNLKTGDLLDYLKDIRLQTYPVQEKSDGIYIDI